MYFSCIDSQHKNTFDRSKVIIQSQRFFCLKHQQSKLDIQRDPTDSEAIRW